MLIQELFILKEVINKEYGSDFHLNSDTKWNLEQNKNSVFNDEDFSFFFSGRSVLYAILDQGILEHGWEQVYFPSFYCHEVVEFIQKLDIKVNYYNYNPFLDSEDFDLDVKDSKLNVIINVCFFGLKKISLDKFKNAVVLEDLTHSILDFKQSNAAFCFGSVRKELPVPSGGFCYSPKKYALPKGQNDSKSNSISIEKQSAMLLKSQYIAGVSMNKEIYRAIFKSTEAQFAESFSKAKIEKSSKKILLNLDVISIIQTKKENIKLAFSMFKAQKYCQINFNSNSTGSGLLLYLKLNKDKINLQNYLVSNSIYPATLWPNQKTERDKEVENKSLFIHLDYRYSSEDVLFIIDKINNYFISFF